MPNSLWPHGLQHTRLSCLSPSPGVCSNSCPLIRWWHSTISTSISPFSSCPQSLPSSGYFPMSWLFALGDQTTRASASASVFPVSIQGWFPLRLTDLLAVQGTLRSLLQHYSLKASVFWRSTFFTVQLSQPYVITRKTIALTIWTFVGRMMSLLFNTLCRFVIVFLPSYHTYPEIRKGTVQRRRPLGSSWS